MPRHLIVDLERAAHALAGLGEQRVPPKVDVVRRRDVGERADVELDVLEVPPRPAALEGLAIQGWPVGDAAVQVADVHKVELAWWIGPGELSIVDLKAQVRWDPGRLDRANVEADDRRGGELVGDVTGAG